MSLSDVEPLDSPQYEELSSITRSLHLDDATTSYNKQRLMSHKIVSKTVNLNVKVLWFAPTRPMNENNMYGNVSFTLDWKTAIEQLGPYLYYIDHGENRRFYYGRVLLTNKKYDFLTPVDDGGHGMPMLAFNNKHYAAATFKGVKHVLEIGVEVDFHSGKWLYMNCKIEANDHSSANTLLYKGGPYNPCNCHRFNYFKNKCPSPYKLQQIEKILRERWPTMLSRPTMLRKEKQVEKEQVEKKQVDKKQVAVVRNARYDYDYYHTDGRFVKKQVEIKQVEKKQVEVVRNACYDYDYYHADGRYKVNDFVRAYHHHTPKKKKDEGMSTGGKVVVGALVVTLCWYSLALWRRLKK